MSSRSSGKLKFQLRWRLSVMWMLQWGITGAILTYLPIYFADNGLTQSQTAMLMATSAVGLWFAPFAVGQICDRWMATEKYLAIAHFMGGLSLLSIPVATDMYRATGNHFSALMFLVGAFAVFYFPTIPLASSLTFRHLPDPDEQFGKVRIWGTVGWVMAGWFLSIWLGRADAYDWLARNYPGWKPTLDQFSDNFRWMAPPSNADCFRLAALLSFALSSFCVFLPATPPQPSEKRKIAPLETLKMFGDKNFSLLIAISFLLATVVPLYTYAVPEMLKQLKYQADWVPALMTLGQISEFPALILLPLFLKRVGLKRTFALGMIAWLLRYAFFAFKEPSWLILAGISLHGICHVFLIIVIQLYVDRRCRPDLRASAQNLFAFLTMGIAMPLGFLAGGVLGDLLTDSTTREINYQLFFLIPAIVILVLLYVFYRFVEIDETKPASAGV
jgi:MFS family permease